MPDFFDRLETRPASVRESAFFRDLRHVLSVARARVPSLRARLKGVDIAALQSRQQLGAIPILRESDLADLQREQPPLGGLTATRLANLKQVFLAAQSVVSIEGQAKDWWGAGRALYAAGLRKGRLVLNCFSYDLVPDGHIVASGAAAIGAPLVAAGNATLAAKLQAVQRLRPTFFTGPAAQLKSLLDLGIDEGVDLSCMTHALVTGPMSLGLRNEFRLRGICVRQMVLRPEVGVIAFECGETEGMTVNENLFLEIVDPVTLRPCEDGVEGEIVVTRINADYPLVRLATGDLSMVLPHASSCGRTNMRIRTPRRAQAERLRLDAQHLSQIQSQHPTLGRMRLYIRPRGDDVLHLKAEQLCDGEGIEQVSETLQLVTRLRGTVEFVAPGTLGDDEGPIVDERSLN